MLEVLYDTTNNEVRGWCADPKQFGNFKPKPGEALVILPEDVRGIPESDDYFVDLVNKKIIGNPNYTKPAIRDLWAEMDELKAKVANLESSR